MKTLSKLKSEKWIGCFIQGEWNWPISCLNDSETQERGHERVQIQNFPGEHVCAPPEKLQRSFSKLVSIYPRCVPELCFD